MYCRQIIYKPLKRKKEYEMPHQTLQTRIDSGEISIGIEYPAQPVMKEQKRMSDLEWNAFLKAVSPQVDEQT